MQIDDESIHVHVECKHGFALISGIRDDTLQPACFEEKCKKQGERWLQSQGLMASDEVGSVGAAVTVSNKTLLELGQDQFSFLSLR